MSTKSVITYRRSHATIPIQSPDRQRSEPTRDSTVKIKLFTGSANLNHCEARFKTSLDYMGPRTDSCGTFIPMFFTVS